MSTNWSAHQTNIFSFVESAAGNAIVEAVAGSGKTTTLVEAVKRASGTSIFLAFNKAIAEELKSRGVNARTFHSMTYSITTRSRRVSSVETNKTGKVFDELVAKLKQDGEITDSYVFGQMYKSFVCKLVGLGKQVGIGCLVAPTQENWNAIVEHHDLELENETADMMYALQLADDVMQAGIRAPMVDFDDMLYLPVLEGMTLPKYDFVFVDEAQDTNAIQRALLKKIMHPKSRLIAVGDPAQAIYGFRGADSDSLHLIAREFNCTTLPLSVTYRCATSIVSYAHQWVSHIEAAPGAVAGEVEDRAFSWKLTDFTPEDLVVCRTTKPLVALAYRLLRARIPASIRGNDIGAGIKSLIKKMNARSISELETRLDEWSNREIEKAVAKGMEGKGEAIADKADTVRFLIGNLEEDKRTVDNLLGLIDQLFANRNGAVQLSTIHKAKGLEANRVFWLNRSQCPSLWARQDWQKGQEANLCYVAATRAKSTLVLIEEKKEE